MKLRGVPILLVVVLVVSMLVLAIPTDAQTDRPVAVWPTEGWATSTPEAQGMDSAALEDVYDHVRDSGASIRSLLVVRHGYLVAEEYFTPILYDVNDTHILFSVTKSVVSCLIGIAIDQGLIRGVGDTVLSYFPEYSGGITDPQKQNIRLQHLLTLTSGLEWDEKTFPYSDSRNSETQMIATSDWMRFVLERPLRDEPGTTWVYNTGSVHLLSGIIRRASGVHADEFAETHLFRPLGIDTYEWNKDPQGHPCTGGTLQGLRLTARDVAKFGYLFLDEGKWDDVQVVPKTWVEESTRRRIAVTDGRGCGYLWFTGSIRVNGRDIDHFFAAGYGGQSVHIVPELNLMVVFLCWNNAQDADIFIPLLMIYEAIL